MFLPNLQSLPQSRDMTMNFAGYNHNLVNQTTESYDELNLSSALYPVLSPRPRRGYVRTFTDPHGLHSHNGKLAWVDGTNFYYNGEIKGTVEASDKQMVSMGAYICIFPDKKIYNTQDDTFEDIGAIKTFTSGSITWAHCTLDGAVFTPVIQATAPSNPTDGQYWIDTSSTPHVLKKYSATTKMWGSVPTPYVKLSATGIDTGFNIYDGINIKGMTNEAFRFKNPDGTYADNGDFVIYAKGTGYIVIVANVDAGGSQTATEANPITFERKTPDLDFVTESENRLWGCNSEKHEIYACALGDPKNWYQYMGTSQDAYALTVGSDGDFTGAITHLGYVIFFKEDVIHRLYGSKPANYQLTNINARGIKKGSDRSPVIVNETLFYHSTSDVCAFASSLPSNISANLGTETFSDAVGGTCGGKYYVSLKGKNDAYTLFVFDIEKGIWHKEDNTRMKFCATVGEDLYFIDEDDRLISVKGNITDYAAETASLEDPVNWEWESGPIGIALPDRKFLKQIQIRFSAEKDAEMEIYTSFDNKKWECKYSLPHGTRLNSSWITVLPHRADTFRIKIKGKGDVKIYSITQTIEQGSQKR